MNLEEHFFLSVLADHLNGRTTQPADGLDWAELHTLARKQNFGALVYAQCGEFMPPEMEASFLEDYSATVNDYALWQAFLPELEQAFARENIPFVPFKGVEVAACYPQPDLRKWADLDMLVRPEDFDRADAIVRALGFTRGHECGLHWEYGKGRLTIELHRRLVSDSGFWNVAVTEGVLKRVWDFVRTKDGGARCQLDPDFHFVFLIAHTKKHAQWPGLALRQFVDLVAVTQRWTIDWQKVESLLAEAGLEEFARRCFALCERWFGVKMPLSGISDPAFEREVVRQTLEGIKPPAPWKCDTFAAEEHHLGAFRSYFPSYDALRTCGRYKFVDNCPWLVPVAWLYRFVSVPARMLASAFALRRRAKRSAFLEKLG